MVYATRGDGSNRFEYDSARKEMLNLLACGGGTLYPRFTFRVNLILIVSTPAFLDDVLIIQAAKKLGIRVVYRWWLRKCIEQKKIV